MLQIDVLCFKFRFCKYLSRHKHTRSPYQLPLNLETTMRKLKFLDEENPRLVPCKQKKFPVTNTLCYTSTHSLHPYFWREQDKAVVICPPKILHLPTVGTVAMGTENAPLRDGSFKTPVKIMKRKFMLLMLHKHIIQNI